MALTREQLDFIKRIDDRRFDSGHAPSAAEVMVAGQLAGVDFDSEEEVEAFLRELREQ